ncbi:uncharacterized protein METZ01_LOCUS383129, partial [marine metagenome]
MGYLRREVNSLGFILAEFVIPLLERDGLYETTELGVTRADGEPRRIKFINPAG